jgi:hypothetical protein
LSVQNGRSLMRSEHRKHDRLLVTRFAMDDAYPSERDEAHLLIESCPDCAALAADVRQLSVSVGQVPVPARTRDFTITAEKAEDLRGSRLARWMRSFATPRWGTLRPVAGVALSIGLVMAVVGTALPSTLPAAVNEGAALTVESTDNSVPPQAPESQPPMPVPAAGAENPPADRDGFDSEAASASQDPISLQYNNAYASPQPVADGGVEQLVVAESRSTTRDLLVWAGLAIATISVGLLALAFVARRYFADPLLR